MDDIKKTKIQCGDLELVFSEQIIMDSLESEIVIALVIGRVDMGKMRIRFIKNESEELAINLYGKEKELTLECTNFSDDKETGTIGLMPIGEVEGKTLKMHLWTKMLGNSKVRRVDICLYKEI